MYVCTKVLGTPKDSDGLMAVILHVFVRMQSLVFIDVITGMEWL